MNILHLWDGRRKLPKRLQIDFIKKLNEYCNFYVSGINEFGKNSLEITPKFFNTSNITVTDIINEYKIDALLLPEYSVLIRFKMLSALKYLPLPKIILECDYWGVPSTFYKENKIDLVITRGFYNTKIHGIPTVWLPHSANELEFYTDPTDDYLKDRKNIIIFLGNLSNNKYYRIRREAVKLLEEKGLIKGSGLSSFEEYPEILKECICALSCAFDTLKQPPAKVWEIMASGAALLVQEFIGMKLLFGKEQCFFTFKRDLSNLEEKAAEILSDRLKVEHVTKNALNIINEKHLDKHRIKEYYEVIKAFVEGNEVPRPWGYY